MSLDTIPHVAGSATSRAAAEMIRPSKAVLRMLVLTTIKAAGTAGLTDEEGISVTGINPSTYRPRRGELVAFGDVIDSGIRRKAQSGCKAVVWLHLLHAHRIGHDWTLTGTCQCGGLIYANPRSGTRKCRSCEWVAP